MTTLVRSSDLHAASAVTVATRAGVLVSLSCRCTAYRVAALSCEHPEHARAVEGLLRDGHRRHVIAALQ